MEVGAPEDASIDIRRVLPALYPAAWVFLPHLTVSGIKFWLRRHGAVIPAGLVTCADRRLRGGLVAWRGCGLLFADGDDPEEERVLSLAHEAAHFLGDHLYPRLDLVERLGPSILPVLDGDRPPTLVERVDALLARTSLSHHTHLMGRAGPLPPALYALEEDADTFARELLAPTASLERHFPELSAGEEAIRQVAEFVSTVFRLPPRHAMIHARAFVARCAQPVAPMHRLGFA